MKREISMFFYGNDTFYVLFRLLQERILFLFLIFISDISDGGKKLNFLFNNRKVRVLF